MHPGDFDQLLGLLGELDVDVYSHRYDGGPEEGKLNVRSRGVGGLVVDLETKRESHPAVDLRTARTTRDAGSLSVGHAVEVGKLVERPRAHHASQGDFSAFAKSAGYTDHIAATSWSVLHGFWGQRSSRATYLADTPFHETNPTVLIKTFLQSKLPLSFDAFQVNDKPTDFVNLISLYHTITVLPERTPSLIDGFGGRRVGFVSDYLNNTLNPRIFPPLPVSV